MLVRLGRVIVALAVLFPISIISWGQDTESCGICHRTFFQDWLQSRHSQSWKSADFQAQLQAVGNEEFCGRCHASQSIWSRQQMEATDSMKTPSVRDASYTPKVRESLEIREAGREEGVNCRACHVVNVLWEVGSADDFVGPYHTETGHGGREADQFAGFSICSECHGRPAEDYIPADSTGSFHHSDSVAYEFSGSGCATCHMPPSTGKLVQLRVFKDAPERTVHEHSFSSNNYSGLEGAIQISVDTTGAQPVLVLTNNSVGHPPKICAETSYHLLVTSGDKKDKIELLDARQWRPGEALRAPLPFAYEEPRKLKVEFFRVMKDGFEERLFGVTL